MSAIIPYLQPGTISNAQSDITDLQALSGMPDNSLNHGTFTGVTIPDSQTTKQALQALETEVEDRLPDFVQWQKRDGGYWLTPTAYLTTPINDFGLDDFSIIVALSFAAIPTSTATIFGKTATANSWRFYADASGYRLEFLDGASASTVYTFGRTVQLTDRVVGVALDRSGNATLYVNGESIATVDISGSSAINLGSGAANYLLIGNASSGLSAEIKSVRLFNYPLNEAAIAKYSRGEATAFVDRITSTVLYESDFTQDLDGWAQNNDGTLVRGVSVGGDSDVMKFTLNTASGTKNLFTGNLLAGANKRYKVTLDYYIPSSNNIVDGFDVYLGSGVVPVNLGTQVVSGTTDAWTTVVMEAVNLGATSETLQIFLRDSGNSSSTIQDVDGDDYAAFRNIKVELLGEVATYIPSTSAPSIWADASLFGRNAANNGATLLYSPRLYADEFVLFSNLPTSSAGLATGQVWNDSGTLKIV